MITRRHFLLGAPATAAGIVLPRFFDRALSYFENHGEPLLLVPKQPDQTLYWFQDLDGQLVLDSPDPFPEPPTLTWREYYDRYFDGAAYYEALDEDDDEWVDLDAEVDMEFVVDVWSRSESPQSEAYHLLSGLEIGLDKGDGTFKGELIYYDGPMPGSDYLGVHAPDAITLSLLQACLNEGGHNIAVMVGD